MVNKALQDNLLDEATKQLALEKIANLYLPYHSIIHDLYEQVYGGALYYPSRSLVDALATEIRDIQKQLRYIKTLEARLKD